MGVFTLSQIINKFLPVQIIPKRNVYKGRGGSLASGGSSVILNTSKVFTLDYFEWSCNHHTDVKISFETTTTDGVVTNILAIPPVDGTTLLNSTRPTHILNQYSGIWDVVEYNEDQNVYKFRLNLRGLEFNGLKVTFENTGAEARNVSAILYGRENQ